MEIFVDYYNVSSAHRRSQSLTANYPRSFRVGSGPVIISVELAYSEQKLVDTMLAADVFYNVHSRVPGHVVVVSSDDDLWPLIRTALQFGSTVVHVHTEKRRATRPDYVRGDRSGYVELNLHGGIG